MPRTVPEWIGATHDAKVPARVKLRIWRKQCGDANFAICPLSGGIMRSPKECELDHERALIANGEHRESNLRYVLTVAHREKSKRDVAEKAKVDSRAKRHLGIRDRGPLAGADREERQARRDARSADRQSGKPPLPPRRSLFEDRA